jgi:hypothetical protein
MIIKLLMVIKKYKYWTSMTHILFWGGNRRSDVYLLGFTKGVTKERHAGRDLKLLRASLIFRSLLET